MGRFAVVCAVLATAMAACFFEPTKPAEHAGDAGIDGAIDAQPDAPPCATSCTGSSTLHLECPGTSPTDLMCGWGCVGSGLAHCGFITPAGGAVAPADLAPTGLNVGSIASEDIDTDTG